MADSRDTIYVDIDDEITALIDRVRASNARVIALVLPKRAAVMQSIVNMKLLKRTADNEKKNLVLITNESGLMPLAGAVGLHVAQSLTSKPEIPPQPSMVGTESETVEEDLNLPMDDEEEALPDLTKQSSKAASVGSLADAAKRTSSSKTKADPAMETLQLDDEESATAPQEESFPLEEDAKPSKKSKQKKPKIPNFDRFRVFLILGILVIIGLIVLGVFAFAVWPRATIAIKTNASNVNSNLNLTLDTNAQSLDPASDTVPAQVVTQQKTYTQTVNTTGQKNEGTAATGTISMTATDCSPYNYFSTYGSQFTVPAGTGLSYNNLTYITQGDTTMNVQKGFTNGCFIYKSSGTTNITAQSPGTTYNTQISSATVSGYSEITANGSASGGTDNIVQVVAQADVTSATSKINANNSGSVEQALSNELMGQGMYPVNATFASGTPQITSSPSVGSQSNTVTVTETVTYTMFGVKKSNLQTLVSANVRSQTGKGQNIISDGITESAFKQVSANSASAQVTLTALAEVGPNISVSQIKKEAAGQSPQAIISALKSNPDVTNVSVRLSPFWVSSAPSNTSKITVKIAKPSTTAP